MNNKILIYGLIGLILGGIAIASTWVNQGSDLSSGTFSDTSYNSTILAVELNRTASGDYAWNGTYTSAVKDMDSTVKFLNLSWGGKPQTCPANMAYIDKLGGFCIDKYEASVPGCDVVGDNCAMTGWANYCTGSCTPDSGAFGDTAGSGTTANATSRSGVPPIASISRDQARKLCSNNGKYLCTSKEWLAAANIKGQIYNLPTGASGAYIPNNDASTTTNCNTNSFCTENPSNASNRVCLTGSRTDCHSSESVYDMVGNLWEWTNETVDVINPGGGANWYYVNVTDMTWSLSSSADDGTYGKDGCYFPTSQSRAVRRGGGWGYGANAGVFCAYLDGAPSSVYSSVGFRCCAAPN